jgi:uncharacterized membrane protein
MKSSRDKELREIFNSYLHIGVDVVQIIVYLLVILAIFNTIMSVILIVLKNETNKYKKIKILINNTISICLSGIVFVEIMKLFYIKTYKQLGIIAGIIIIKMILLYFVSQEQKEQTKEINYFN